MEDYYLIFASEDNSFPYNCIYTIVQFLFLNCQRSFFSSKAWPVQNDISFSFYYVLGHDVPAYQEDFVPRNEAFFQGSLPSFTFLQAGPALAVQC